MSDPGHSPSASEPASSPFLPVPENGATAPSPFQKAQISPFAQMGDVTDTSGKPRRPVKLPEKRKQESPFQVVENPEALAAMTPQPAAYPFYPYPPAYPPQASPFSVLPVDGRIFPTSPNPHAAAPTPHGVSEHPSPAPQAVFSQIELRAVFSTDRDMSSEEILQRCRELPGIRSITVVGPAEAQAVEFLEGMLGRLGFPPGPVRVCAGETPVEFIREGQVLLAVLTDNGFAPGVRETLILAAREIARL